MKKLVFDYEMRLSFSAPVTDHRFQLRCIPSTGPRQQVIDVEVKIQPETELETTVVPEFLRTLVFARPRGDDQFADCTFSPSLDMSR